MIRRLPRKYSLLICLAISLGFPLSGKSHDPVTTTVTFNREIIRILERNCLACHSARGVTRDIPLESYEQARPWAKAIKEEVLEKRMMPYQAVKGFGDFHRDYTLSPREISLIVSWVEGGAPKGEEKDLPPPTDPRAWSLGAPDLVWEPENESRLAAASDEYRTFKLPSGLAQGSWVSAVDFQPGNAEVVHCASFSLEQGKRPGESLGNWVPGQAAIALPRGVAHLLSAGAQLTLKIHYRNGGGAATDRSRLALYFAKEATPRPLRSVTIKAAGRSGKALTSAYLVTSPAEAFAIRPLAFPARSIEAVAHRPDGTVEALLWAKNLRDDWQPTYYFRQPLTLPAGTRIEVTTHLDEGTLPAGTPLCELQLAARAAASKSRNIHGE